MTTRLNVNVNDETAEALRELARRRGMSVTEVVRRAVGVLKFVDDEMTCGGKTLQLIDDDQHVTTIQMI